MGLPLRSLLVAPRAALLGAATLLAAALLAAALLASAPLAPLLVELRRR